jgi:lipoprotein-anchoring transpeptidase ErfK/SrfK
MKDVNVMSALRHGSRWGRIGASTLAVGAMAIAGCAAVGTAANAAAAKPATVAAHTAKASTARAAAPAAVPTYTPPKRNLYEGMKGADVKAMQQRLNALKYNPGKIDGTFGPDTLEAVWAFQEVNRVKVTGVIDSATKYALVHPRAYRAHDPKQASTRVEINLTIHVLVFYRNNQIALVTHNSTGGHYWYPCGSGQCFAQTPTGEFHALYFVAGWDQGPLGAMFNPTFFNYDGYAIHGEPDSEVPIQPVSHGCVRIPDYIAAWFYKDLHITESTSHPGTQIWIYN